jgi:hypothetical protein
MIFSTACSPPGNVTTNIKVSIFNQYTYLATMNAGMDQLTQSLIGKNSLNECSVAELQRLTIQYPYFSPAHLLLCQRLKSEDPALYEKQFQKTSLYFQNPLWLQYLSDNYIAEKNTADNVAIDNEEPVLEIAVPGEQGNDSVIIPQPGGINSEAAPVTVQQTFEPTPEPVTAHEENTSSASSEETQEAAEQQEPALPEIPAFKIEPVNESTQALAFEPYHTVDYFASQGIRFKEDDKPKDKFGQQLKSFTEWLKAMKKLPESEVVAPAVSTSDPQVEKLAERSVTNGEVVTESMAEVWEKQGNKEKAIETYTKLSLLNPAKSSYFAAKIEHLKQL